MLMCSPQTGNLTVRLQGSEKPVFKIKPNPGGFYWVLGFIGFLDVGFIGFLDAQCQRLLNKHEKGKINV